MAASALLWFVRGGGPDHDDDDDERNILAKVGAYLIVARMGLVTGEDEDEDTEE